MDLIGKKFFFDERLAQYRNVLNPNEFYDVAEMDTLVEIKRELDITTDDTPEVRELMRQWDELSRAS